MGGLCPCEGRDVTKTSDVKGNYSLTKPVFLTYASMSLWSEGCMDNPHSFTLPLSVSEAQQGLTKHAADSQAQSTAQQ